MLSAVNEKVMIMNTINPTATAAIKSQERAGAAEKTDIDKSDDVRVIANESVQGVNTSELVNAVREKDSISNLTQEQQQAEEKEVLENVASNLQEFVNLIDKELQFTVDTETGRQVVTVKDGTNGEIIRQIPSEEVLKLAQNLAKITDVQNVSGALLETEV